jgi:hydrogenase maturation protein HypF
LADGVAETVATLCAENHVHTVVVTGGVFQNATLLCALNQLLALRGLTVWTNQAVPAGDGGLSLGQAAFASLCAQ